MSQSFSVRHITVPELYEKTSNQNKVNNFTWNTFGMLVSQKILHSLNKILNKKSTKRPVFNHAFPNTSIKSSLVQIN